MKTTVLISLLCIASLGSYAQESKDQSVVKNTAVCRKYERMPAGATLAWPSSQYISKVDPQCAPCYTYVRKSGLKVMECPGLWFPPENVTSDMTTVHPWDVNVQDHNTYTGNYPKVCKRDADMPRGAKPAFPKSEYTPTQDPSCAPCYTYTRKSGLKVMECPFLYFPAEK